MSHPASTRFVRHIMQANKSIYPLSISQAIQKLYTAFANHKPPMEYIDACTCCMEIEKQKEMMTLPLKKIPASLFYEYNDSAKSQNQPANEIKYFLPRMLEVLAEGAEIHHSVELYLDRIGRCAPEAISDAQRAALDEFALSFFSEYLRAAPWSKPAWSQFENAFGVLLMFDIGGFAIEPLLQFWLSESSEASTLHYVESSYFDFWTERRIENAFATDRIKFQQEMNTWLINAENQEIFYKRIQKLNDSSFKSPEVQWFVGVNREPSDLINSVLQKLKEEK
jgi:hypothetical protein